MKEIIILDKVHMQENYLLKHTIDLRNTKMKEIIRLEKVHMQENYLSKHTIDFKKHKDERNHYIRKSSYAGELSFKNIP